MARVRYSFSSRRTGHIENIRKQREDFPEITLKLIDESDIILEIIDARFIEETRNKELEELIKKKRKLLIYILNKSDLVDKSKFDRDKLKEMYPYVFVSAKTKRGVKDLRARIKIEAKRVEYPIDTSGKIRIAIIGYPNTGKSSLINVLLGRHSAGTASEAGYTKGIQKVKLSEGIHLIDSPGVIPRKQYSKTESEKMSQQAKVGGRSFNQVKEPEIVIQQIVRDHKGVLESHYNIDSKGDSEILVEELGKRMGFFKKKGIINEDQVARFIVREWQEGKIKI